MLYEKLIKLRENQDYDREELDKIANEMEDLLGEDEMWRTLRVAFSYSELLDNLEYIAHENDV